MTGECANNRKNLQAQTHSRNMLSELASVLLRSERTPVNAGFWTTFNSLFMVLNNKIPSLKTKNSP
jgi:hypothetical protein